MGACFSMFSSNRVGSRTIPAARYNATMTAHKRERAEGRHFVYRPIFNRFGFTKGMRVDGESEESRAWTIGINPVLFPYTLASGPSNKGIRRHYQIGVPDRRHHDMAFSIFLLRLSS